MANELTLLEVQEMDLNPALLTQESKVSKMGIKVLCREKNQAKLALTKEKSRNSKLKAENAVLGVALKKRTKNTEDFMNAVFDGAKEVFPQNMKEQDREHFVKRSKFLEKALDYADIIAGNTKQIGYQMPEADFGDFDF